MKYGLRYAARLLWLLLVSINAWALDSALDELPEQARVWENRSNQEGTEYQDFGGKDVAYINSEKGGWYYHADDGRWHLFHEGSRLDLQNSDSSITESLQLEVVAGTPFFDAGPAGQYGLLLDGPSGELVTEEGVSFDPSQFELLRSNAGQRAYYDLESLQWWPTWPLFQTAMSAAPKAPYHPVYLSPNMYPGKQHIESLDISPLVFELDTLRYRNAAGHIVGFHPKISSGVREWRNDSNMPCSPYSDYPGDDVVYVDGIWYHKRSESHFEEFSRGRYLSFDDQYGHAFLSEALTAGGDIGSQGGPAQEGFRLDGETGDLVGEDGQAVDPQLYRREAGQPLECSIRYMVLMNDSLSIRGLADAPPFVPKDATVTLLSVVPLRQIANNPFDGKTLPFAIQQARFDTHIVQVQVPSIGPSPSPDPDPGPADPPPAPGSCPVNSALTLIEALPSGAPLANEVGITGLNQLNAGFTVSPTDRVFLINNPLSPTQGVISMGSSFSYVSGSSLGNQPEGANLSYRVRRNSDSAEFEVNFSFRAEIVFDDLGIVIDTLSGRQCTAGGPL